MLLALLKGFGMGGSLIVAIGAQNAFVIRQGLLRRHLILTASLCAFIDALLIMLGVLGFGEIVATYPMALVWAKYFAIAFLLFYGALAVKSAFTPKMLQTGSEQDSSSKKKTILVLLALSLLNPHVYLDTVILLGSIASQQPEQEQIYFALGAIGASFAWFFTITFASSLLAPFLRKETTWRMIDSLVAFTMWAIAILLLTSVVKP